MDLVLQLRQKELSLIDACVNNERWAQKQLFEDYYTPLMTVCLRYAGSSDEAQDVLHDGFLKIFKNISKYQAGTSLAAWLHRLMVNHCIDHYRKMQRRRTEDLDAMYHVGCDDPDAISQCTEKDILNAVQHLSPTYRTVFNMYVLEGYSHREIGTSLNITESTSRSNLVKARNKLRDWLSGLAFPTSNEPDHAAGE
jgi:RNA polymerase sigma factor (sigma-70 family)